MADDAPEDLLDSSYYRPLFRMLARMDDDIEAIYTDSGHAPIKSRYVGPLIELHRAGELTVRALAERRELTHSAMSQTVAAMRKEGLVDLAPGEHDARTRVVRLTETGRDLAPLAIAEWRATETTVRELDAELSHPLMRVVAEIETCLARTSFKDRLLTNLAAQQDS